METRARPQFLAFNEHKAVRIYHRNLPHWRQDGATYFVTFRLGDSIPKSVLGEWEYEKKMWLAARGIQYDGDPGTWRAGFEALPKLEQFRFQKHFNRKFHTVLDEGRGACYLKDARCRKTVREKLFENDGYAYDLGDFVLMPNHVHLLVVPARGEALETTLKKIKGASARQCNLALGRGGKFWQADSYDHIVRSIEQLASFRQYIEDNPAKAGIHLADDGLYRATWMDQWFSQ